MNTKASKDQNRQGRARSDWRSQHAGRLIQASLALAAVLATSPVFAQSTIRPASTPAWWAQRQADTVQSRADFAAGNIAQAESTLLQDNRNAAGTPAWHLESAHRLAEMAFSFRDNHQPVPAVAVANRALLQLALAESAFSGNSARLADAEELAGLIYDQLLEDKSTAMTHYQNAVQLDGSRAQAALRLRQLQTRQAVLAAKRHG